MTTRCLLCDAHNNFSASRGSKLKDQRCNCGGKLELLSHAEGENCFKNKNGELFVYVADATRQRSYFMAKDDFELLKSGRRTECRGYIFLSENPGFISADVKLEIPNY